MAKVEDKGTPSLSSSAVYTVSVEDSNDNPPVFIPGQTTSLTIREDQPAGEPLLTIQATDRDTGKILSSLLN